MRGWLDLFIYYATAPIRLFGRSRRSGWRSARSPSSPSASPPRCGRSTGWRPRHRRQQAVAAAGAAAAATGDARSYVIAPCRRARRHPGAIDAAATRELVGKNDNAVSSLLSKDDIGIAIVRGSMAVSGRPHEMTIATLITGNLKISGQIATPAGTVTDSITGLIDSSIGKTVGKLTSQVLDQRAELRGQVTVRSKPTLTAHWRLEPNLTGEVALADSTVTLAGIKINVASEAKPLIDREVNKQIASLQTRLRNDPIIERSAREQWSKMCRSIPLGGDKTGLPSLWLEMRPVRAAAAQPQVDSRNVTLTVGVQAETRIVPTATQPVCPFPAQLELVAPMDNGKLAVGVPIDVPFTELNRLLEAQLKGKRFPEDGSAPVEVEVRAASLAAASNRLLISLRVKARERKSWFGFGAQATVHIWGKPALDRKNQILRLSDLTLAVESEAAFGLLGAAARAAMPYLQQALADKVLDLKPFAADALKKITLALAEFQQNKGVKVDTEAYACASPASVRFNTLRVIAEADAAPRWR